MDKQICLRLADLLQGGETPSGATELRTKSARVTALGWRTLPFPNFWRPDQGPTHSPKQGDEPP